MLTKISSSKKMKLFSIIFFISLFSLSTNILFYSNSLSFFSSNNKKYTTIRINLSAPDPGEFLLHSTEDEVYSGEAFQLYWSSSTSADNYSIYKSEDNITVINEDTDLVKDGLTERNYNIIEHNDGTLYYVIVAYNETGQTLSNCVKIKVLPSSAALEEATPLMMIFFLFIGVIAIVLVVLGGSIYYAKRMQMLKDYGDFQRQSSPDRKKTKHDSKKQGETEIKSAKELINLHFDNKTLLNDIERIEKMIIGDLDVEMEFNFISDESLNKIDKFKWKNEQEKLRFIKEILSLPPEEQVDVIEYMLKKAKPDELF